MQSGLKIIGNELTLSSSHNCLSNFYNSGCLDAKPLISCHLNTVNLIKQKHTVSKCSFCIGAHQIANKRVSQKEAYIFQN